jgi:N-acetylneuraminate synthase
MRKIKIGSRYVGDGEPVLIIAEIGINHNGSVRIAKELIDVAAEAGCDAVKFQKRTIDLVYTKEELDKPRESPWGTTNREQKQGLEFNYSEYKQIDEYCKKKKIMWFASCWDTQSVDFIDRFNPPCYKIPSALLTHDDLLLHIKSKKKPMILSTGMSTLSQIKKAVSILGQEQLVLLHCTSTYPSAPEELNLTMIPKYKKMFTCPIGYSGHETGVFSSAAAATIGASVIERHITLDRAMYGSDQAASLGPPGLTRLVRDIRLIPVIMGDGIKRVYETELPIMEKLRRKN